MSLIRRVLPIALALLALVSMLAVMRHNAMHAEVQRVANDQDHYQAGDRPEPYNAKVRYQGNKVSLNGGSSVRLHRVYCACWPSASL